MTKSSLPWARCQLWLHNLSRKQHFSKQVPHLNPSRVQLHWRQVECVTRRSLPISIKHRLLFPSLLVSHGRSTKLGPGSCNMVEVSLVSQVLYRTLIFCILNKEVLSEEPQHLNTVCSHSVCIGY